MLFNSLSFLVFFPIVTFGYFLLPHRFRWSFLLAASSLFYMAFVPEYVLILFALILVDYCAGLLLEKVEGKRRRYILWASILSMVLVLVVFKYFNFFNANVAALASFLHWNYSYEALSLLLPIGLSFHTFQSLSYVIEVYYGRQKAERHLGIYALYVMFYPQLVAGPIERPQHMLHQFHEQHSFDYGRVTDGLKRMAWGLFKKVVIADRLALFVDPVFADPHSYGGLTLLTASVFFVFQLYCDFSGYTDIALGSAKVMGFTLMENFNRPFAARSIPDFWRRWHISLSTWFRDYFFTPLALSLGSGRLYLAIFLTFLATGFWHGANWTFGVFGALHGAYIVIGMATKGLREKILSLVDLNRLPRIRHTLQVITMFILILPGLVFFRSKSVAEGWYIVTHWFGGWGNILEPGFVSTALIGHGMSAFALLLSVGLIVFLEIFQYLGRKDGVIAFVNSMPVFLRYPAYLVLIYMIIAFGASSQSQFIYFQF